MPSQRLNPTVVLRVVPPLRCEDKGSANFATSRSGYARTHIHTHTHTHDRGYSTSAMAPITARSPSLAAWCCRDFPSGASPCLNLCGAQWVPKGWAALVGRILTTRSASMLIAYDSCRTVGQVEVGKRAATHSRRRPSLMPYKPRLAVCKEGHVAASA
jgi:hypothetical protein